MLAASVIAPIYLINNYHFNLNIIETLTPCFAFNKYKQRTIKQLFSHV